MADKPVVEVVAVDAVLDALSSPTSSDVYEAMQPFSNDAVGAVAAKRSLSAGGGGGGFTPVGCLLARDANFDIKTIGNYEVLWDALYDNYWDLNPLDAIPTDLGLAFAFDGSSSLVAPTEAGVWAFSYFGERALDAAWAGSLRLGFGINVPWVQQINAGGSATGSPFLSGSVTVPLPSGTQLTHQVATLAQADTGGAYVCTQMFLSIVRLA